VVTEEGGHPFVVQPEIPEWKTKIYGRAVAGDAERRKPNLTTKQEIRRSQRARCLYCGMKIGAVVTRGHREIVLTEHWDHFIPYSYSQANPNQNWVLSCQVCNLIKHDKIFQTLGGAQKFLREERIKKGYVGTPRRDIGPRKSRPKPAPPKVERRTDLDRFILRAIEDETARHLTLGCTLMCACRAYGVLRGIVERHLSVNIVSTYYCQWCGVKAPCATNIQVAELLGVQAGYEGEEE
jgi:HNH endonuclease